MHQIFDLNYFDWKIFREKQIFILFKFSFCRYPDWMEKYFSCSYSTQTPSFYLDQN